MLVVIVFYMIGDGLNYAINPKLQERNKEWKSLALKI